MQKIADGRMLYAPSDLINYFESEFASWMDRFHKLFPDQAQPDQPDEGTKILQVHGDKHERNFLLSLIADGRDVFEVPDAEGAIEATVEGMRAGREIVFQGVLAMDRFEGRSDFLVRRDEAPSRLGNFYYEVWDTKLARKPKPYFIIQLCCYAEMLQRLQGFLPPEISVVLGTNERRIFRTEDYYYYYLSLKESFLQFQEVQFDPERVPKHIEVPPFSRWLSHAEKLLEERDALERVANIRRIQIEKLEKIGITTMRTLAATQLDHVPKMLPATFQCLKQQARLQIESIGRPQPLFEVLPPDPRERRSGLALLPPASRLDAWFDMEGYPHLTGGLEYLFGVTHINEDGQLSFTDWWAHDREQEKQAFEEFIDWIYDRWQRDPSMHIYHYASYEVSAVRRLMGRYGTREYEVDQLLRNEVFIDLYQIVRQGLRIGEPSYSIKNIEHLYMDARSGAVAKATDSVVYYERWLESGQPQDWRNSSILKDIRDYNKDDCDSTYKLNQWLQELQRSTGQYYEPRFPSINSNDSGKEDRTSDESPGSAKLPDPAAPHAVASPTATAGPPAGTNTKAQAALLMNEMLAEVPQDFASGPDAEKWRLHQLLAWFLCFHEREYKPVYWSMFDRHAMNEDQLVDDLDCLGRLYRDTSCRWGEKVPAKRSRSLFYEYRFDPDQDTKLEAGDEVFFAHDLSITAEILELDREIGSISIKLGPSKGEPPERLSLIPKEFAGERSIADSIFRTVTRWRETGNLPQAIEDFLLRRQPRINGHIPDTRIISDQASPGEIAQVAGNMDATTLSIQGPPGSGKTYTATEVIAYLIRTNFRIGITSNSHAVIEHLMSKVSDKCSNDGVALSAVKIGGEKPHSAVAFSKSASELFANPSNIAKYNLIGGTAYAFSNAMAAEALDYLFIEEAGQVSVANLIGVAPSARNLVLLGDQMQLEQPIQGSHPGESGLSTLEYLLQDWATVPAHMGIFLGTTRRMRPEVCEIISGMVYEGRLQSHAETSRRHLILPTTSASRAITKSAGVLFIPVEHSGNTQGSDEEVAVIQQLLEELKTVQLAQPSGGQTFIGNDNILVVAPYNMQVRLLQKSCPGVKIGTVDKFQGQEAAIVILSMCTSDGASSPRGIDFIFSQNRLNVAISRAQCLAIVVGHPNLVRTRCHTVAQIKLANFFCRIVQDGRSSDSGATPEPSPPELLVPSDAYSILQVNPYQ